MDPRDEGDDDIQRFIDRMADKFEELLRVLDRFLRARTPAESGALLDQHPELLSEQVDRLLAKFIGDADDNGDQASAELLGERRRYLDRYRDLVGRKLPDGGDTERLGECRAPDHVLEHSMVEGPGYQSTAMRCERCHVGYLAEMRLADDGVVRVDYFVFPADGCDTISTEMQMWAIATCDGTIKEMEADGVPVRRGIPAIGYRPEALKMHTHFTRTG